MFRGKVQRIHRGIGGSGMSGIAEVLITQGYSRDGFRHERRKPFGASVNWGAPSLSDTTRSM